MIIWLSYDCANDHMSSYRMEDDAAWNDIESVHFHAKYLNHSKPAIANYAVLVRDLYDMNLEYEDLLASIDRLKRDRLVCLSSEDVGKLVHDLQADVQLLSTRVGEVDTCKNEIKTLRSELGRVNILLTERTSEIGTLRSEMRTLNEELSNMMTVIRENDSLKMDIASLKQKIEDTEYLKKRVKSLEKSIKSERRQEIGNKDPDEHGNILNFTKISPPNSITWNATKRSLSYNGDGDYSYAVSLTPLPKDRLTQWNVKVTSKIGAAVIGIIGRRLEGADYSYNYPTLFAWSGYATVYIAGQATTSHGSWPGWMDGDTAKFTYNPMGRSLTVHLNRTNMDYALSVHPSEAFIYCNLYFPNSSVTFL